MRPRRLFSILLTAATATAIVTFALLPAAQAHPDDCPGGRGDPAARADERLRTLSARLQLDARQVTRVRAILQEHVRRIQAVRAMAPGPDKRQAREDVRTWTHAQIRAVLTPAQQSTFDAMRAERRRGRGWGRGPGGRGGRGHGAGWGRGGDV